MEKNQKCCSNCGIKYLTFEQMQQPGYVTTFSLGICCVCKENKLVTHIRHYNYLKNATDKTENKDTKN